MNKRLLGKTGIEISELGYGCASLWGKDVFGKQGISEERAYELFETAFENGINFFDTGINYGYAEERLGRCISRAINKGGILRSDFVVETKCGEKIYEDGSFGPYDWSPDWIKKSLEISLDRLKLDYIDLFAMHGGTPKDCTDELIKMFDNFKSQKLIRAFGVNTFDDSFLEWICKENCFDFVMLDYNILKQSREDLIERLFSRGIGVIAGAALGQALYAKDFYKIKTINDFWYLLRAVFRFNGSLKKGMEFRFLDNCDEYSASQLALRYVLDNPNITSAVFGTINIEHLDENIKAANIILPEEIMFEIKKTERRN